MVKKPSLLNDLKAAIKLSGGRYHCALELVNESPEWFSDTIKRQIKEGVRNILKSRRYHKRHPSIPKSSRNRIWSVEDVIYLRQKYGRMKTSKLASILNRTRAAIVLKFLACATEEEKKWVRQNGLYVGWNNFKRK